MTVEDSSDNKAELINLIKNLVYNFVCLIFQHIKFCREEIKEETATVIKSVILIFITICTAFLGAFFGGILLIILFSFFLPIWFSVFFVTILYLLIIPFVLFVYVLRQFKKFGKKQKKITDEIAKTLEETKKWLEQLKS